MLTYFGYDGNQNRVQRTSPRGSTTYFGFDALNRMNQLLDAGGGKAYFGYDVGGNTALVMDPLARSSYFGYDVLDRIIQVLDAQLNSVYFSYDVADNRSAETDARGNTTYYNYDVLNRLSGVSDPLMNYSYYRYDANSNLAATRDNNLNLTYFGYDALDRRTSIIYSGIAPQYFAYDAGGNLNATLDAWGAAYYGYDELSRLTARSTQRLDSIYYQYDAASNLLALQYPQDNKTCYYGYDGANRLTQGLSPQSNSTYFTYDPDSNVTKKVYGDGMVSYCAFDGVDRMIDLRYTKADGTAVAYFDYARDIAGRITIINRDPAVGYAIYYAYDNVDRLLSEKWITVPGAAQSNGWFYSYDAVGNRLQMRQESTAGTEVASSYFAYAADNSMTKRRNQVAGTDTYFYYDLNGARIKDWTPSPAATTYYEYGPHRLCTKITPPTGSAWTFDYDAQQNRYHINRGGSDSYFLWDGLRLLEERDGSGNLVARYTHGYSRLRGIGTIVEIYKPGTPNKTYYLSMDHRGTGYVISDETQTEIGRRQYDAFGNVLSQTGSWPIDIGYQSGWLDVSISGRRLLLSRYRIYDPETGTFLSRDFLHSFNKYVAFHSNPVGRVDATGLYDTLASVKQALTDLENKAAAFDKQAAEYEHEDYPATTRARYADYEALKLRLQAQDIKRAYQHLLDIGSALDKQKQGCPAGKDMDCYVKILWVKATTPGFATWGHVEVQISQVEKGEEAG